jgi:DNA-directed RNA polymerase specialized sigma24 family protein
MRVKQKEQKLTRAKRGQPREHGQGNPFTTVMNGLTPEEYCVCAWRRLGFSSRQIARHHGNSVAAVKALYSQGKAKIRPLLK